MEESQDKTPARKEGHKSETIKVDIMNKLQWLKRHIDKREEKEKMQKTLQLINEDAKRLKDAQVSKHLDTLIKYIEENWPISEDLEERQQFDKTQIMRSYIDAIMHRLLQL